MDNAHITIDSELASKIEFATPRRRWWCLWIGLLGLLLAGFVVVWQNRELSSADIEQEAKSIGVSVEVGDRMCPESIYRWLLGPLLSWADRRRHVTALYCMNTNVTDAHLVRWGRLKQLQRLHLEGTQVTDAGLAHLSELTNLNSLSLSKTRVTDAGMAHLSGMSNLQRLSLASTRVGDAGLFHFRDLKKIDVLRLTGTQVTDAGIVHLSGLTTLNMLFIGNTSVTDASLAHLSRLNNLEQLDVEATQVTDVGLTEFRKQHPKCTVVNRRGDVLHSTVRSRRVRDRLPPTVAFFVCGQFLWH